MTLRVSVSLLALAFLAGASPRPIRGEGVGIGPLVFPHNLLFRGSCNRSVSAGDSNFENAVFIEGLPVIREFEADFERLRAR